MPISPDLACRDCQIAANPGTRGAYNLFECRTCRVRYAIESIRRLAGDDAEATLDALAEELVRQSKPQAATTKEQ